MASVETVTIVASMVDGRGQDGVGILSGPSKGCPRPDGKGPAISAAVKNNKGEQGLYQKGSVSEMLAKSFAVYTPSTIETVMSCLRGLRNRTQDSVTRRR